MNNFEPRKLNIDKVKFMNNFETRKLMLNKLETHGCFAGVFQLITLFCCSREYVVGCNLIGNENEQWNAIDKDR